MLKKINYYLLIFFITCTGSDAYFTEALAAFQLSKKSNMLTPAQISNPHPAKGDILLPMPAGLQMAFRAICIPAAGYLDTIEETHGIANTNDGSALMGVGGLATFTDNAHSVTLSGIYELDNLPSAWGSEIRDTIEADPACGHAGGNAVRPYLYFAGKYEVSRGQWRAVMEHKTGESFTVKPGDYLPQTDISWFEAMEFSNRYSEWLMLNSSEFLPVFKQESKRPSFLRLLTEAEWEFAARGGHKVAPVERARTQFHYIPDGENIKDFIVALAFDETLSQPLPIGSHKPNPLGLYDMLGNSAEIVLSPFQLVSGGKAAGNIGGFVFKGGSWRSVNPLDLHPGRRVEGAYYVAGKAMRRDDIGIRLSIGSILSPKDRWDKLRAEWLERSTPKTSKGEHGKDDVRLVIREVVKKVEDPALKQRLVEADAIASLYHQKVNENEERMMREVLIGALFSLETIANYSARCVGIVNSLQTSQIVVANAPSEAEKARQLKLEMNANREIQGFIQGIHGAFHYYQGMLQQADRYDEISLYVQLEKLSLQFVDSSNGFSRSMTRRIALLEKHLNRTASVPLTEKEVLRDMLNAHLLEKLTPYF